MSEELQKLISDKRKTISTDSYSMSLGELANIYSDKELEVHPEFQRFFRWSDEQKSKLIESLYLNIPIPPIFVSQREDGVWDVIDGTQRLSTIFEFMGVYRDETDKVLPPLVLSSTKLLPILKGHVYKKTSKENDKLTELSPSLKIDFKRAKLDLIIIKSESDPSAKYELFTRLNTLGSALSDQEVRNCLLIMLNKELFQIFLELSNVEPFVKTVDITYSLVEKQYLMELVLLFFSAYYHDDLPEASSSENYQEMLTSKMEVMSKYSIERHKQVRAYFIRSFDLLSKLSVQTDIFARYYESDGKYKY